MNVICQKSKIKTMKDVASVGLYYQPRKKNHKFEQSGKASTFPTHLKQGTLTHVPVRNTKGLKLPIQVKDITKFE